MIIRHALVNRLLHRHHWRQVVPRQMVQESLYVFAAVCPQLGHVTALILPYANSQMMTLFLAHVAAVSPRDGRPFAICCIIVIHIVI
jgi:hypothetical protein